MRFNGALSGSILLSSLSGTTAQDGHSSESHPSDSQGLTKHQSKYNHPELAKSSVFEEAFKRALTRSSAPPLRKTMSRGHAFSSKSASVRRQPISSKAHTTMRTVVASASNKIPSSKKSSTYSTKDPVSTKSVRINGRYMRGHKPNTSSTKKSSSTVHATTRVKVISTSTRKPISSTKSKASANTLSSSRRATRGQVIESSTQKRASTSTKLSTKNALKTSKSSTQKAAFTSTKVSTKDAVKTPSKPTTMVTSVSLKSPAKTSSKQSSSTSTKKIVQSTSKSQTRSSIAKETPSLSSSRIAASSSNAASLSPEPSIDTNISRCRGRLSCLPETVVTQVQTQAAAAKTTSVTRAAIFSSALPNAPSSGSLVYPPSNNSSDSPASVDNADVPLASTATTTSPSSSSLDSSTTSVAIQDNLSSEMEQQEQSTVKPEKPTVIRGQRLSTSILASTTSTLVTETPSISSTARLPLPESSSSSTVDPVDVSSGILDSQVSSSIISPPSVISSTISNSGASSKRPYDRGRPPVTSISASTESLDPSYSRVTSPISDNTSVPVASVTSAVPQATNSGGVSSVLKQALPTSATGPPSFSVASPAVPVVPSNRVSSSAVYNEEATSSLIPAGSTPTASSLSADDMEAASSAISTLVKLGYTVTASASPTSRSDSVFSVSLPSGVSFTPGPSIPEESETSIPGIASTLSPGSSISSQGLDPSMSITSNFASPTANVAAVQPTDLSNPIMASFASFSFSDGSPSSAIASDFASFTTLPSITPTRTPSISITIPNVEPTRSGSTVVRGSVSIEIPATTDDFIMSTFLTALESASHTLDSVPTSVDPVTSALGAALTTPFPTPTLDPRPSWNLNGTRSPSSGGSWRPTTFVRSTRRSSAQFASFTRRPSSLNSDALSSAIESVTLSPSSVAPTALPSITDIAVSDYFTLVPSLSTPAVLSNTMDSDLAPSETGLSDGLPITTTVNQNLNAASSPTSNVAVPTFEPAVGATPLLNSSVDIVSDQSTPTTLPVASNTNSLADASPLSTESVPTGQTSIIGQTPESVNGPPVETGSVTSNGILSATSTEAALPTDTPSLRPASLSASFDVGQPSETSPPVADQTAMPSVVLGLASTTTAPSLVTPGLSLYAPDVTTGIPSIPTLSSVDPYAESLGASVTNMASSSSLSVDPYAQPLVVSPTDLPTPSDSTSSLVSDVTSATSMIMDPLPSAVFEPSSTGLLSQPTAVESLLPSSDLFNLTISSATGALSATGTSMPSISAHVNLPSPTSLSVQDDLTSVQPIAATLSIEVGGSPTSSLASANVNAQIPAPTFVSVELPKSVEASATENIVLPTSIFSSMATDVSPTLTVPIAATNAPSLSIDLGSISSFMAMTPSVTTSLPEITVSPLISASVDSVVSLDQPTATQDIESLTMVPSASVLDIPSITEGSVLPLATTPLSGLDVPSPTISSVQVEATNVPVSSIPAQTSILPSDSSLTAMVPTPIQSLEASITNSMNSIPSTEYSSSVNVNIQVPTPATSSSGAFMTALPFQSVSIPTTSDLTIETAIPTTDSSLVDTLPSTTIDDVSSVLATPASSSISELIPSLTSDIPEMTASSTVLDNGLTSGVVPTPTQTPETTAVSIEDASLITASLIPSSILESIPSLSTEMPETTASIVDEGLGPTPTRSTIDPTLILSSVAGVLTTAAPELSSPTTSMVPEEINLTVSSSPTASINLGDNVASITSIADDSPSASFTMSAVDVEATLSLGTNIALPTDSVMENTSSTIKAPTNVAFGSTPTTFNGEGFSEATGTAFIEPSISLVIEPTKTLLIPSASITDSVPLAYSSITSIDATQVSASSSNVAPGPVISAISSDASNAESIGGSITSLTKVIAQGNTPVEAGNSIVASATSLAPASATPTSLAENIGSIQSTPSTSVEVVSASIAPADQTSVLSTTSAVNTNILAGASTSLASQVSSLSLATPVSNTLTSTLGVGVLSPSASVNIQGSTSVLVPSSSATGYLVNVGVGGSNVGLIQTAGGNDVVSASIGLTASGTSSTTSFAAQTTVDTVSSSSAVSTSIAPAAVISLSVAPIPTTLALNQAVSSTTTAPSTGYLVNAGVGNNNVGVAQTAGGGNLVSANVGSTASAQVAISGVSTTASSQIPSSVQASTTSVLSTSAATQSAPSSTSSSNPTSSLAPTSTAYLISAGVGNNNVGVAQTAGGGNLVSANAGSASAQVSVSGAIMSTSVQPVAISSNIPAVSLSTSVGPSSSLAVSSPAVLVASSSLANTPALSSVVPTPATSVPVTISSAALTSVVSNSALPSSVPVSTVPAVSASVPISAAVSASILPTSVKVSTSVVPVVGLAASTSSSVALSAVSPTSTSVVSPVSSSSIAQPITKTVTLVASSSSAIASPASSIASSIPVTSSITGRSSAGATSSTPVTTTITTYISSTSASTTRAPVTCTDSGGAVHVVARGISEPYVGKRDPLLGLAVFPACGGLLSLSVLKRSEQTNTPDIVASTTEVSYPASATNVLDKRDGSTLRTVYRPASSDVKVEPSGGQ